MIIYWFAAVIECYTHRSHPRAWVFRRPAYVCTCHRVCACFLLAFVCHTQTATYTEYTFDRLHTTYCRLGLLHIACTQAQALATQSASVLDNIFTIFRCTPEGPASPNRLKAYSEQSCKVYLTLAFCWGLGFLCSQPKAANALYCILFVVFTLCNMMLLAASLFVSHSLLYNLRILIPLAIIT